MQKRCIRILTFAPFDAHTNQLFSKLGIIKIEDVIVIQKLLFMLEVQQKTVPAEISKLFQINDTIHNHQTRSSHLFHIPKAVTSRFGLKSSQFSGPILWNQYHHYFSSIDKLTKPILKNFLTKHLLSTYT